MSALLRQQRRTSCSRMRGTLSRASAAGILSHISRATVTFCRVLHVRAHYRRCPSSRRRRCRLPFCHAPCVVCFQITVREYPRRARVPGAIELRSAIASFLSRSRGIDASAEDIVIGSGAEYLYGLIPALLGRDRIYATERPSYKKIEQVYRSLGAECENLTLGEDGILSEELAASRASVLHISPYRSYPSGVSASLGKRLEYIDWVRGGDRYIIEDDLGSEFSARRRPEETVYSLSGQRAGDICQYLFAHSSAVAACRLSAASERRQGNV